MFYRGVASYIAYYFLQFYSHCDNLLPFSFIFWFPGLCILQRSTLKVYI